VGSASVATTAHICADLRPHAQQEWRACAHAAAAAAAAAAAGAITAAAGAGEHLLRELEKACARSSFCEHLSLNEHSSLRMRTPCVRPLMCGVRPAPRCPLVCR